jgi:hypothetical protein
MTLFCLAFQAGAELEGTNDTDLNMSNESSGGEFAEAYVINIEEKRWRIIIFAKSCTQDSIVSLL